MYFGLTTLQLSAIVLFVGVAVAVVSWLFLSREATRADEEVARMTAGADAGDEDDPGHSTTLEPPEVRTGFLALLGLWRHRAKALRLAEKGYVRWYKLGATVKRPKWVKPSFNGSGEGEYYDRGDDVTYLFPREAMLPDARTGAWVALHRENESDPVNLRDGVMPAIPADRLQEIINLMAESEKPGFLDQMNLSTRSMMVIVVVVLFLVYAAYQLMGGGIA